MLTFRFTGVNGEMIEEEMLAAGMVGKQVQFVFSEEWEGLRKVAVYKAGSACCTTVDVEAVDTIPAEVLERSLQRLQVGVYGISEDGSVVTPTIYATGPFIHISAVLGDDPCFDPENTFWIRLEEAIGELSRLTTEEKTSLVLAINENQRNIQTLAKELPASGLDKAAGNLLMTILKNGIYATDQSENILRFGAAVCGTVLYTVEMDLENVAMDNSKALLEAGDSYAAVLTPAKGHELEIVTVTMGGEDITAQVYAAGVIAIPEVRGNITVHARAESSATVVVEQIVKGTTSYYDTTGLHINSQTDYRATIVPVGQYLRQGIAYHFSLGDLKSSYRYGVQILQAGAAGLTFPYAPNTVLSYNTVTDRLVDSGWMSEDYIYTANGENLLVQVNFKHVNEKILDQSDYATLMENFTIVEVAE